MTDPLATVIATALQAARELDEEAIRAIVREELAKLPSAPREQWATPPKAARACGVSLKRVRALMAAGTVEKRRRNLAAGGQAKWEIKIASLEAALAGESPQKPDAPIDATAWAARRSSGRSA